MVLYDIMLKFQQFRSSNGTASETVGNEQNMFSCFVRKDFLSFLSDRENDADIINYIDATFTLFEKGKIEPNLPFLLIEDLIEIGSYSSLEHLLLYLDEKSTSWAFKLCSKKGVGLILLRSVNLLRRKIVRSEHSKLAGLSLLLLTKIFPASERSGVNLKGDRNIDNTNLTYNVEHGENLFSKLCVIHKSFYIYPSKLFENDNWKLLTQSIDVILFKFEEVLKEQSSDTSTSTNNQDFFSPQHLFTEKSFELQLQDQTFRLSLLCQILVLLQDINYLSIESNNHKAAFKLEGVHETWIGDTTKRAFYLISLHKFGKEYFRFLRSIFRNEKNWINWKINSCLSYEKCSAQLALSTAPYNTASANSDLMGNEELHRLWSYSLHDVNNRILKPEIEPYLERIKLSEDEDYVDMNLIWRANRLKWKINI